MLLASLGLFVPTQAATPTVRLVEFDSAITPVSALRITQAIDDAEQSGDSFVLIQLDTPGGLVVSMDAVVKRILGAKIPIVVWVGPAGARAASAGFFVLIAADVAAMAPGTRTGAASTVYGLGENREGDVLLRKANEDHAALLRSIANRRGRNAEACEKAVFAAKAYEEGVALSEGLIDLVVNDREELMRILEGREVTLFDGTPVTLRSEGARFVTSEFSLRHRFMEFLATPALAALLLLLGLGGLYFEFTNPGTVFPGVVGALCLLLFALTARVLPISAIGILLIVLGAVMFVLEIKVTSYGMLSLGGLFCLIVGMLMLIDGPIPELRVPLELVLPSSLLLALFCVVAVRLAVKAQSSPVGTGLEGLKNEIGHVTRALEPDGKVFVHGEIWNGRSVGGAIAEGGRVRVVEVDNLKLTVEPIDESPDEELT